MAHEVTFADYLIVHEPSPKPKPGDKPQPAIPPENVLKQNPFKLLLDGNPAHTHHELEFTLVDGFASQDHPVILAFKVGPNTPTTNLEYSINLNFSANQPGTPIFKASIWDTVDTRTMHVVVNPGQLAKDNNLRFGLDIPGGSGNPNGGLTFSDVVLFFHKTIKIPDNP